MSGIYIHGVEMPKNDDEYVIFTVYGDGGVVYGPLNRPHVRYKNRAVPVPDHGRLIDADAALKSEQPANVSDEQWAKTTLARCILDAPTIITASKEG